MLEKDQCLEWIWAVCSKAAPNLDPTRYWTAAALTDLSCVNKTVLLMVQSFSVTHTFAKAFMMSGQLQPTWNLIMVGTGESVHCWLLVPSLLVINLPAVIFPRQSSLSYTRATSVYSQTQWCATASPAEYAPFLSANSYPTPNLTYWVQVII